MFDFFVISTVDCGPVAGVPLCPAEPQSGCSAPLWQGLLPAWPARQEVPWPPPCGHRGGGGGDQDDYDDDDGDGDYDNDDDDDDDDNEEDNHKYKDAESVLYLPGPDPGGP